MALVVFLKGVNVGGHRTFRPKELATSLKRFDVVNIGAAGTFVVRKPPTRDALRAELARRLPFVAEVMICSGRDIQKLIASEPFARTNESPTIVRFVNIMAKPARAESLPFDLPNDGQWLVRVLACDNRFVLGLYRRDMRTIGHLGQLERILGGPATTRNWNTMLAIGRILHPDSDC